MRVAVLQSNYIPWKGYFDIIHDVDLFVFYDDVQFTKNDWRNRNLIKTPSGLRWLTIPVGKREDRLICDVSLPDSGWAAKHWRSLEASYRRAPRFETYRSFFEELYLARTWTSLSAFNQFLITRISTDLLNTRTAFADSRSFKPAGQKQDRLLDLLHKVGATEYLSGPAAKSYIDVSRFEAEGIAVDWKDYSDYPEYPQLHPPFAHHVTLLDLLFHTGCDAPAYIWAHREGKQESPAHTPEVISAGLERSDVANTVQ